MRLLVVTRYRARTSVERWQLQDRLRVRLEGLGITTHPRFGEMRDGRLAFTLWRGLSSAAHLTASLERIDADDRDDGGSGTTDSTRTG